MAFTVLLLSCLLLCGQGAFGNHDDVRVTSLPGWSGSLPSAHYSGYVDVDAGRMHYVFVESENQCGNERDDVPLVLWVQGGPGCSSLLGFFTEMGTFTVAPSHDASLTLELNAHRWSKCAHMLYWESPVGVGFSYSPTHQYKTNDSLTADMNMQFLVNWFKVFPEYSSLDFYIAGESYAGIYIPMVTSRLLTNPAARNISLKGILVGNGCIGNQVGACSDFYDITVALPYLNHHGLVSDVAYSRMLRSCSPATVPKTPSCIDAVNAAYKEAGQINVYNVLGTCYLANATRGGPSAMLRRRGDLADTVTGLPECLVGQYAQAYLQDAAVHKALNVVPGTQLAPWTACSDTLHAYYGETVPSVLADYAGFIGQTHVMIYNGDADARIPFTDNQNWTSSLAASLGLRTVEPWQPWLVEESQVGGYITKYSNDFGFMTVRGAGHMVPQFKPAAAFEMFKRFLSDTL